MNQDLIPPEQVAPLLSVSGGQADATAVEAC